MFDRSLFLLTVIAAVVVLLCGCADDTRTPSVPDATIIADTGVVPDAGGLADATLPDVGFSVVDLGVVDTGVVVDDDDNDTIANATPISANDMNGILGVINPAGDRDFYAFDVAADEWLVITATGNVAPQTDPVLRLYGPDESLVAENDDALPAVNINPELIYHTAEAGTYYVEVLEYSDWNENDTTPPRGGSGYTYTLRVDTSSPDDPINIDPENGDTEMEALVLPSSAIITVAGTLNAPTDVDYFRFSSIGGPRLVEALVLPIGPNGYGGSSTSVAIAETSTTVSPPPVIARIPDSVNYEEVGPNLPAGDYYLAVGHPDTPTTTDNPFYVVKLLFFETDNPPEMAEPNNSIATAEALTLDEQRRVFVLASLPENDIDYFAIDVLAGESVSVACRAESAGSAVRGLFVQIRDGNDEVLGIAATETPPNTAFIQPVEVPAAGRYYVRLAAATPPAEGQPFVRCGIRAF